MANVPIEESLSFDVSGALQGISQIDDALTQVVQSFQVGLASALETLTSAGADVPPLADTLDVAGLGPAVDTALSDALSAPQPPVSVEADTAPLTDAIDSATAVVPVVGVNADTTEATTAIDALAGIPVDIPVTADTSEAQTAIDDLGVAATTAAGSGGAGVGSLSNALEGLSTITPIASGETGGLVDRIAGLTPATAAAAGGLVAVGAFIGDVTKLAADAEAQQKRFNEVFGQSAQAVQNINVGGLTISLKELGIQSATSSTALQSSASHIGELGKSSGASAGQIVSTTDGLLALAGAAAVTNPHLGDTAEVTDRLSKLLQSGGARLSAYGISLTSAQIGAEGVRLGLAATAKELTPFDKLVAGTTLALQQQGSTLGTTFATGAANAQIQLRSLKVQLEETLAAIGQPLLQPAVDSFKALLPVAQEVGIALGSLARGIFPIIADLAPALIPLAAGLGIIGQGLQLVADGLGLIPAPVIQGLALGFVALGVAIDAAAGQLGIFGLSLDFALGPIGLAIGVLAAVGIAARLAGDEAQSAAVDTSALDSAFQATNASAAGTTVSLGALNTSIDAYLQKALAAGTAGHTAADAAESLGISNKQLADALGGSDTAFSKLEGTILNATGPNEALTSANNRLFDVLQTGRDTLEANAQAQLTLAVQSGLVTKATVDNAEAHHLSAISLNQDGTAATDFLAVLNELEPGIRAAQQATIAQKLSTGELQQAFLDLKPAIADGTVTESDAQTIADKLGISLDDAKSAVKSLSTAMDQFVSSGLSALPAAGAAISDFATGISTAQSNLDSVLKSNATSGGSAANAITRAQDQANQAIANNATRTAQTIQTAQDKVNAAQANLASAEAQSGSGQAAAVNRAQAQLQTALNGLTNARTQAGISQANAVSNASQKVSAAQDASTQKQQDDAKKAKEAQDAYLRAIDPQRVIDAEFKNAFLIGAFQANLTTLLKRGRDNAVAALIAEGPEKGGQLANILVNNDTKAKAFDDGIAVANQVTSGYGQFLEASKAKLSGRLITIANGSVIDATNSFSGAGANLGNALTTGLGTSLDGTARLIAQRFHPDFTRSTSSATAAAVTFLENDKTVSQAAGNAGLAALRAYEDKFGPTSTAVAVAVALNGAHDFLINDKTVPAAAGTAGNKTGGAFKPPFSGQTASALAAASTPLGQIGKLTTDAGTAGHSVGIGFGSGLVEGLNDKTQVAAIQVAASGLGSVIETALKKALGIKSPSTVGVDIGSQFVLGIAQGMAALSPLHQATAALTLALIPDLRPALKQIPSLAPGIVASSPVAGRAATSAVSDAGKVPTRRIESTITLNRTDPDPKHFADELAWSLQGV